VARSGQKSIAQGLPWVDSPTGMSPEGAGRYGGNRLRTYGLDRVHSSPFRAKRLFRLTQGKPWAKFSCPFGAGRLTDAKQIRTAYLLAASDCAASETPGSRLLASYFVQPA
jgi:hypothetical protein